MTEHKTKTISSVTFWTGPGSPGWQIVREIPHGWPKPCAISVPATYGLAMQALEDPRWANPRVAVTYDKDTGRYYIKITHGEPEHRQRYMRELTSAEVQRVLVPFESTEPGPERDKKIKRTKVTLSLDGGPGSMYPDPVWNANAKSKSKHKSVRLPDLPKPPLTEEQKATRAYNFQRRTHLNQLIEEAMSALSPGPAPQPGSPRPHPEGRGLSCWPPCRRSRATEPLRLKADPRGGPEAGFTRATTRRGYGLPADWPR